MKKIAAVILSILLVFSLCAVTPVALAAEDTAPEITGSIEAAAEKYSDISYFEFINPYKIAMGATRIAIIEQPDDGGARGRLLVFSLEGDFLFEKPVNDPRDVEIIGNNCFVLDYDYNTDATLIYAFDLTSGDVGIAMEEPTVFDMAASGNYIYALCGVLSRRVERYTYTGTVLTKDDSFTSGTIFANATLIAASSTHVLAYQSSIGIPTISAISLSDNKRTDVTSLPSGGVIEFGFDGDKLYILNGNGCFAGNLSSSPDFVAALLTEKGGDSESSNIVDPVSFALDPTTSSKLLILEGKKALSVKSFTLSSDVLLKNYFSIASFSADEGAFNTPLDATYSNGKTYYADSLNRRIVIRTDSNKNQSFKVEDSTGRTLIPKNVGVDYFGNIYVSTETKILKYSSTFKLLDEYTEAGGKSFSAISALYVSPVSEDVYAVDAARLVMLDTSANAFVIAKTSGAASDAITVDMRYGAVFFRIDNAVTVYDYLNFTKLASFNVGSNAQYVIKDLFTDFDGSVYVLTEFYGEYFIYKFRKNGDKYVDVGNARIYTTGSPEFSDFGVDYENGVLYLISSNEHRAYKIDKSDFKTLGVSYYYGITIPKDIFDAKEDLDATVGTVLDTGNKIIYPLNLNDALYPVNYAVTRAKKLNAGEKLVVAGITADEKFAYVIYNNAAGFMDVKSVSTNFQYEEVPYEYGVALHENVYLYKYPLIATYNLKPLYAIAQLKKDTPVTIINRASDYLSPSGLYWYYVSYQDENGNTVKGYIPRYNTVENTEVYDLEVEYGQINADLLKGYVEVYADLGETPIGVNLQDKTKIKIIDATNKDYVFIQEVKDDNTGVIGYVKAANVTYDAQTKSTTTALILIAVLVVVVAGLIVAKVLITKYKRKHVND